jgi:hypothetical protein
MPAAATAVQMDMKELAELIVRRLADEQINPLTEKIQHLGERLAKVEAAVVGNGTPPLAKKISDLDDKCDREHQRLHDRISTAKQNDSRTAELRERLVGAYYALGATGAVLLGLIEAYRYLKGGH